MAFRSKGQQWRKRNGNDNTRYQKPDQGHTFYLSFFLHRQNFWRIKFTPKKRVNYDKIHSKLPIFCDRGYILVLGGTVSVSYLIFVTGATGGAHVNFFWPV